MSAEQEQVPAWTCVCGSQWHKGNLICDMCGRTYWGANIARNVARDVSTRVKALIDITPVELLEEIINTPDWITDRELGIGIETPPDDEYVATQRLSAFLRVLRAAEKRGREAV